MEKKISIPQDFWLGASSSAWQTEGWSEKKGRRNYMDLWYQAEPECWYEGYGPAAATDYYNRYREDISLMKECGIQAYRTSIDWSRLIRDYETAEVDPEAAAYYQDMIDCLSAAGIEPMICLEHYELPGELFEKYGGWASRHVVDCYVKYVKQAFRLFGDKVRYWFTFNEPIVIQTRIYLDAARWPYEQNTKIWMQWNYHKVLAHALAVQAYHEGGYGGKIGIILNPEVVYPRSSLPHDLKAAYMYDLYYNRSFMDPCILGSFPEELLTDLKLNGIMFDCAQEDMAVISTHILDFVGMNLYYPKRVKGPEAVRNPELPFHPSRYYDLWEKPGRRMNRDRGWEIYPRILYDIGMRLKKDYGNVEWMVTENGMGVMEEGRFRDASGRIQDQYRTDFIREHLYWAVRAAQEGSCCRGYLVWAFTDCVSPMNSFKNRYGLVEIDLEHGRDRRIKASGDYFRRICEERKFTYEEMDFH